MFINTKIIKILILLAYGAMVTVNYLAMALPIAGRDTGAISDSYPNLFTPAGYAFSIWGVIYILLGIYIIYQFKLNTTLTEQINRIFIINALLNASWIVTWHYDQIWLSVLIMIGLLVTLIKIANILQESHLTQKDQWFIRLPFSVYFGWITVATIANITVFLVSVGWNGFNLPESFWTIIVLLIGTFIGSWRIYFMKDIPYGLVFAWAYGAILTKHLSTTGFDKDYPGIIWTVILCLLTFVGIMVFIRIKKKD